MLWTNKKTEQFGQINEVYNKFFFSTNDKEEILKNHKAAVEACKSALKLLNTAVYHDHSRFEPCKCLRRVSCNPPIKTKIAKEWKIKLKFLTNEKDMLESVSRGVLKKYIYDVIKCEIFDKVQKIKPNK